MKWIFTPATFADTIGELLNSLEYFLANSPNPSFNNSPAGPRNGTYDGTIGGVGAHDLLCCCFCFFSLMLELSSDDETTTVVSRTTLVTRFEVPD